MRLGGAVALMTAVVAVPLVADPAAGATARATHISVATTPTTVIVGGTLLVGGTVTPAKTGSVVTLQRATGGRWKTLASRKSGVAGTFAFHLKAPKQATAWSLRVTRAAAKGLKGGVSATQHVHIVKTAFSVTAAAGLGTTSGTVVVSGKVSPKTSGKVVVQRLQNNEWIAVATGTLRTGTYSVNVALAGGASYTLRVMKAFTSTVATGTSRSVRVTVPPPAPVISTTTLPKAVIGRAFTTTLAATLGTPPYTWSATGLPDGITLTSAGVLAGKSLVAGSYPTLLSVTDAGGQNASVVTTLVVQQTSLMAWGYNYSGELGDGTVTTRLSPVPVSLLNAVTQTSGFGNSVLALRTDGSVWAWGANDTGGLGLPSVLQTSQPTPVTDLSSVVAVASGLGSGYALTSDGTVWATGANDSGELGDGTTVSSRSFAPVVGLGKATAIASGVDTAYALLRDGTVWSWGDNGRDQLGDGLVGGISSHPVQVVGLTGVTAIASDGIGGSALLADGTVRAWGSGRMGALGNGATTDSPVPVSPVGLSNVRTLANNAGVDSFAIKNDGTVWAWGDNTHGTIGDGTKTDRLVPTQVPDATGAVSIGHFGATYAVMADGTMRDWGENSNGALGLGDMVDRLSPTTVPGLSGVVYTAGSEASGFAVVASG